jgi:hypothetical protein
MKGCGLMTMVCGYRKRKRREGKKRRGGSKNEVAVVKIALKRTLESRLTKKGESNTRF